MAKLGINQELEVLFNRVLNKPEHEGVAHYIGDCMFSFSHVVEVSFFSSKGEGHQPRETPKTLQFLTWMGLEHQPRETQKIFFSVSIPPNEGDYYWAQFSTTCSSLPELLSKINGALKVKFRRSLSKYLQKMELTEKLEVSLPSSEAPKRKIAKI